MSYHHCPIEPPDWSDGPDYDGDCRECEGTGEVTGDDDIERTCQACGGSGFVEREPLDDDVWLGPD